MPGGGGAPNFITGAGGFAQALWAGYGGLRLESTALRVSQPQPLPNSDFLVLHGVNYLGRTLYMNITHTDWRIVGQGQ